MKNIYTIIYVLFAFFLISCSQHNRQDYTARPLRILFIGNSLTHYNGGLDYQLRKMFAQSSPKLLIYSDKVAPGGERLSGHYSKGKALRRIKEQKWDIVVLQEYSNVPIINKEDFYKYSKLFVEEIRKRGSNAIFYMTFSYKANPEMTALLSGSYLSVGRELECDVVPVGIAWDKVLMRRPSMEMYTDFKHPSPNGTYLAACMFYSFLTGLHPSISQYTNGLDAEDAAFIQDIAWETVSEWKKYNEPTSK
ncbi:MAG: SGNH/GDSL hydrolase family protein [Candidatus Kapaibacterium sp.]